MHVLIQIQVKWLALHLPCELSLIFLGNKGVRLYSQGNFNVPGMFLNWGCHQPISYEQAL